MDHMVKSMYSYQNELMGKIEFDAWYQRPEVWSKKKKQKLIDSILRGYDIGVIYIRDIDDETYDYEVLDGQQRLRAIDQFMLGEYKTSSKLNQDIDQIQYDELKQHGELLPRWNSKELHFQKITKGDDRTVADFFLRLQEGMELNTAEILNAIVGDMRSRVISLSKHDFLKKTGITDTRFRHRLLVAQVFNLEINGDFENKSFPRMGKKELLRMYESYRTTVPRQKLRSIKRTLNLLNRIFEDASYIRNQGDFLPIYMLTRYLKRDYAIRGLENSISDFVAEFLLKVHNVDVKNNTEVNPADRQYYDYRYARMSGALSSRSFKIRFNVILGQYLQDHPNLQQKDESRAFDYGQKLAIYQRDNGLCQICDDDVKFEEAEFHHESPYVDGGSTVVDNGVLVHPDCHPRGLVTG